MGARDEKIEKLRELMKWPEFNPRSLQHVREFLFGVPLSGKKDADGNPLRLGPSDALRLNLEPLFDTSKPPKAWVDIKAIGKEDEHSHLSDFGNWQMGIGPAKFAKYLEEPG
jgi:hypothetical protein